MIIRQYEKIKLEEILNRTEKPVLGPNVDEQLEQWKIRRDRTVVVLDDDPTGIQTVHGVNVYMDWAVSTLTEAFQESRLFFIQTNSRALQKQETIRLHTVIMENLSAAAKAVEKRFTVMSRGDSTLRGHYPAETAVLKEVYERETGEQVHGEILIPFFLEGGRYTWNNIHYVLQGDTLVPAAQTEFARDSVFGYHNSDLAKYIHEKTEGAYPEERVVSIPLEMLRAGRVREISSMLACVGGFDKVIVNALSYADLKVFALALAEAESLGKRFMFRTAASFVKVYGCIKDKELMGKSEFEGLLAGKPRRTLVVVGSHVKKTGDQLRRLLTSPRIEAVEMEVEKVLSGEASRIAEIGQKAASIERILASGRNAVLYTSSTLRGLVKAQGGDKEDNLLIGRLISDSLVEVVRKLTVEPSCIIAKGGITSSDTATKGMGIRKARVLGQVLPGIPVILAGQESKWPGIPYIIFPGNVGDEDALKKAFETVVEQK